IVPTKNERLSLPRVLEQFRGLDQVELIVTDGGSHDGTPEMAQRLGALVVRKSTPRQTIGQARNEGAALARGRIFVFCDADTQLAGPDAFLSTMEALFQDPRLAAVVPRLEVFPEEAGWFDRLFHFCFNLGVRASFWLGIPSSGGQCQVVRREAFEAVNGYPEEMAHGEDSALLKRLRLVGRVQFAGSWVVYHSPRRFRVWGYPKTLAISIKSFLAKIFLNREVLEEWERVGK
ncbi:MAG: glycosyltransferase, partial [Candidatus Eremiobacteraeota bacterium]|nr:glycosyltransferase [Candidatus Eremiobacteraeota bacterium]